MAERLDVITQRIGHCLWQIQELEGVAATYFVLLTQLRRGMDRNEAETLVEKAKSKTFGVTVRQIVQAGLLDAALSGRLTRLLEERNWLVHQSRRDSRNAVHHDASMQKLLGRIELMGDEAGALLQEFGVLTQAFGEQRAVSTQRLREMAAQLLDRWHSADDD